MTAVDSLEQASNENLLTRLRLLATDHAPGSISRITIQQAIAVLTRPPGGSERLRELVAKWRYPWQKNGAASEAELARDQCADELESALTSPQGAEPPPSYRYPMDDGEGHVIEVTNADGFVPIGPRHEQGAEQRQECQHVLQVAGPGADHYTCKKCGEPE